MLPKCDDRIAQTSSSSHPYAWHTCAHNRRHPLCSRCCDRLYGDNIDLRCHCALADFLLQTLAHRRRPGSDWCTAHVNCERERDVICCGLRASEFCNFVFAVVKLRASAIDSRTYHNLRTFNCAHSLLAITFTSPPHRALLRSIFSSDAYPKKREFVMTTSRARTTSKNSACTMGMDEDLLDSMTGHRRVHNANYHHLGFSLYFFPSIHSPPDFYLSN